MVHYVFIILKRRRKSALKSEQNVYAYLMHVTYGATSNSKSIQQDTIQLDFVKKFPGLSAFELFLITRGCELVVWS